MVVSNFVLSRFAGTTGKPKGAAISHGALIVQSLAKIAVVNYCSTDVRFQNSAIRAITLYVHISRHSRLFN